MKLWKKAAGLVKDRNSIWAASISHRTSYRNPDLESIVIKATSHDDSHVNYKNFHLVYKWVRTSPMHVKPLLHAISSRMEKTRSWVVALKGLMLMHGVIFCKIPAVKIIGRLPFDLSKFHDGHSRTPSKTWRYDKFVRAYYTYLDQRSHFLSTQNVTLTFKKHEEHSLMEEIEKVRRWQELMEMLLHMRPDIATAKEYLVFEAMICVLTEVFDVYSRICKGIARLLMRVYAAKGAEEAKAALEVVEKAVVQGKELETYLEYCKVLGLVGSSERVEIKHISKEDIIDLERIIYEASDDHEEVKEIIKEDNSNCDLLIVVDDDDDDDNQDENGKKIKKVFRTIITDKWEVFHDDDMMSCVSSSSTSDYNDANNVAASNYTNPFLTNSSLMPYVAPLHANKVVLPDLITF